jgi:shikimate dehydrogenase
VSAFDDTVAELTREFLAGELALFELPGIGGTSLRLAGAGTIAPTSVRSPALHAAAAASGLELVVGNPHGTAGDLVADGDWDLAVVLSPCKRDAVGVVDACSPSASDTDVVDTILRTPAGLVGLNTNVYAAGAAITRSVTPARCDRVAILGTGASARSVAVACRRWLPDAEVVVVGRSPERAAATAAELGVAASSGIGADLVVNTTSWGETEESEASPSGIDLDPLLVPGTVVFDINNRVSLLKRMALERACAVVPGTLMQRLVNALRIAAARRLLGLG